MKLKQAILTGAPIVLLSLSGLAIQAQNGGYPPPQQQQGYPQQQPQGYPQQQQGYPQQQQQQGYPQQGNNQGYQQRPPSDYGRPDWDAPPQTFNDLNRRAYHDGIDAARSDFQSHRNFNYTYAGNYRRPPVDRRRRDEYRSSFAQGYAAGQRRMQWMSEHHNDEYRHDHDRWSNNYPSQPR